VATSCLSLSALYERTDSIMVISGVLQRIAVCCSVLLCVANVLQFVVVSLFVYPIRTHRLNYGHIGCVAACCSVLQCVAVCYSVFIFQLYTKCVAACCSVLQRVAVRRSVLQCVADVI